MRRRSFEIDFDFFLVLLLAAGPFTHRNARASEDSNGPNESTLGQKGEIFIEASGEDGPLRMTVNHASIIEHWDQKSYEHGKSIYHGHCVQCHGENGLLTPNKTARAFGKGPLCSVMPQEVDGAQQAAAGISEKGRAVLLKIPDLHPIDQLQINFQLQSADEVELKETVYLNIHRIPKT